MPSVPPTQLEYARLCFRSAVHFVRDANAQHAGRRFAGEIVFVLPVQIRTAISGYADSKALPDGVACAPGPVCVLVLVENAARMGRLMAVIGSIRP